MSAHMKRHRIKKTDGRAYIRIFHKGAVYQFPKKVAEKYKVTDDSENLDESVDINAAFKEINQQYSKPGALLKGLRIREGMTQIQIAEGLGVTQSDISQMENGTRRIGRKIAQRIEKLFGVNYRVFLE